MPQLFRPSSNTIAKVGIVSVISLVASTIAVAYIADRGPWSTSVALAPVQPVEFSHKHHVKDDGIDCRYCHTSVENSGYAGLPPTETCMSCHSQIWSNASVTQPIRDSWASGRSIEWTRVHDLPDFVYFNHSIHLNKGIGCSTCHGQINEMALTYKVNTLNMNWCVNCHRNPAQYIRPRSEVYNMAWERPTNDRDFGKRLVQEYKIASVEQLT